MANPFRMPIRHKIWVCRLTENFSVIFDFGRLQKDKKEESSQAKPLSGVNFALLRAYSVLRKNALPQRVERVDSCSRKG